MLTCAAAGVTGAIPTVAVVNVVAAARVAKAIRFNMTASVLRGYSRVEVLRFRAPARARENKEFAPRRRPDSVNFQSGGVLLEAPASAAERRMDTLTYW